MDDEEVIESKDNPDAPKRAESSDRDKTSYPEALRIYAQFFLYIGMPRDLYWYGDPYIVEEYLGAYKLKRQEENWIAWLGDIYTFDAITAALANIHFDKGQHKTVTPMEKPMQIFKLTPEEEEAERQKKIDKFVQGLNDFHAMMEAKKNAGQ